MRDRTLIDTWQFAEWIAERYNYVGGDLSCWCAKQYDANDCDKHQTTAEVWKYWDENIRPGYAS